MSINSTSTEKQKFQSRYSTLIHLGNRGLTIFKFQKKLPFKRYLWNRFFPVFSHFSCFSTKQTGSAPDDGETRCTL